MAVALTCRSVVRRGGKYYVRWSDKTELEFTALADVRAYIRDARDDGTGEDTLRVLLLARWLEQNPAGDNPALLAGRTITLDLTLATNIVRVT